MNNFLSGLKQNLSGPSFVNLFSKMYVALSALGVWWYSEGYDYYQGLNGRTELDSIFLLRMSIYALAVSFVFEFKKKWSVLLFCIIFYYYEFFWGSGLKVFTTNLAAPILAIIVIAQIRPKIVEQNSKIEPIKFAKTLLLILSSAYLVSAMSKLFQPTSPWISGNALAAYFYESYLFSADSWKLKLSENKALMAILSILTMFWELSFISVLWSKKKTILFFASSGLIFHAVVYLALGPNFFFFFFPCYLAFIPPLLSTEESRTEHV